MTHNMNKVLNRAFNTKEALLKQWSDKQEFSDENNLNATDKGVLTDSIGLTSLLLLYGAFNDEKIDDKPIFSKNDENTIFQIINTTVPKILDIIEEYGYNAEPLFKHNRSVKWFDKENSGYTDAITWVLSFCSLTKYIIRKNKKDSISGIDTEISSIVNKLLADTLKKIIKGQREDGSWGFRTSKTAESSLYYSYAIAVSLKDFYLYILNDDSVNLGLDGKDTETIKYIQKELNIENLEEKLNQVRNNFSQWLLENCLPYLPKLAECRDILVNGKIAKDVYTKMGIDVNSLEKEREYLNLYYTYYVVDAIISNNTNDYYQNLDEEQKSKLISYYKELKYSNNRNVFKKSELDYFFNNGIDSGKEIWREYIKQAIHISRGSLQAAIRTGEEWWDSADLSELKLSWKDSELAGLPERPLSDPALVPMAVRANIQYCYYVSKRADITVDELFDIIDNNVNNDENSVGCVYNLWDDIAYSLQVTERAVEAIVDYYDYVKEYEQINNNTSPVATSNFPVTTTIQKESELDKIINERIDDRIKSYFEANPISVSGTATATISETDKVAMGKWFIEELCKVSSDLAKNPKQRTRGFWFDRNEMDYLSQIVKDIVVYHLKEEYDTNDNPENIDSFITIVKKVLEKMISDNDSSAKYSIENLYAILKNIVENDGRI